MFSRSLNSVLLMLCLVVSVLLSFLIHFDEQNEINNTLESSIFILISSIPPMFYRIDSLKEVVMVIHMITVSIALYYTFSVNALLMYIEKYNDTNMLTYSSVCCIAYSATIVFGHFMKRKDEKEMVPMAITERNDI